MDPNACFALYLVSDEFPEIKRECCDDLVKWIKAGDSSLPGRVSSDRSFSITSSPIINLERTKIMNQTKFETFSEAYKNGLREAVEANPDDYFMQGSTPEVYAEVVSGRMMKNIADGKHMGNNYDGGGFRRACKKVGIKHTRKAILEFLEIK